MKRRHMTWQFALLITFLSVSASAEVRLAFGNGPGQVGYVNRNTTPLVEEPLPLGPLSFRVDGQTCWVADSINGRLYHVAANGSLADSLVLPEPRERWLIEDFTLTRDIKGEVNGFWVVNGCTQQIVRLDRKGRRMQIVGGSGDAPNKFREISRLEVGASGRLYVADKGRRQIVILRPDGTVVRAVNWQWSGLCLDRHENLCTTMFDGATGQLHFVIDNIDGKRLHDLVLDIGPHRAPEIWYIARTGEVIMTYVPADGPLSGEVMLARVDGLGAKIGEVKTRVPLSLNHWIEPTADNDKFLWQAIADYRAAPAGHFRVERVPAP